MQKSTITAHILIAVWFSTFPLLSAGAQPGGRGGPELSGTTGIGHGESSGPSLTRPPPPGVNSAGTANASGGAPAGTVGFSNPSNVDEADGSRLLDTENRDVDRKIGGICRGC